MLTARVSKVVDDKAVPGAQHVGRTGERSCAGLRRERNGDVHGMTSSRVNQVLAALHAEPGSASSMPDRLCAMCTADLPLAGVALLLATEDSHHGVVAATSGLATTIESLQFDLGEGPGLDASAHGRPVLEPDLATAGFGRWPAFGPAATESGVAAVFAFPLHVGSIRLGALDMFRSTAGGLDETQMRDAYAYADAAIAVILQLQELKDSADGAHPRLAEPLLDRPEIHQATGMVSVQAGIGLAESLLLLRAHAYSTTRPLLDTARDVLGRTLNFHPDRDDNE